MRTRFRFGWLLMMLTLLSAAPMMAQETHRQEAADLLAALNTWRIQNGQWPLTENATLDAMALAQAQYILSLPEIPDGMNIHLDAHGRDPATRALGPKFGWPSYGRPDRTAINEIAYVGRNSASAIAYWDRSALHHSTALNDDYREVGVAALSHTFGYLYIVVVGSRPNVLPTVFDTEHHTLYLTDERYRWSGPPYIQTGSQVRIFDNEGRPLHDGWLAWNMTISLPDTDSQRLFLAYESADVSVLSEVWISPEGLPNPIAPPANEPEVVVVQADTPSLNPTNLLPAPTSTPEPVPQLAVSTAPPNVRLVYDNNSLVLVNISAGSVNIQDVSLVGPGVTFPVTRWQTQWFTGSLSALTAGSCLQIYSWLETTQPPAPANCRSVRSVLTISPEQFFWTEGAFEVRLYESALGLCAFNGQQCEFAVPPEVNTRGITT